MRAAPAVHIDCAEDNAWRVWQLLLIVAATLSFSYWLLAWIVGPGKPAVAVAAGLACVALWLAARRKRQATRRLAWDGTQWTLEAPQSAPMPGRVSVAFDLGGWMLLRFVASDGLHVSWLPLARRASGAAWHGLNVALHGQSLPSAMPQRQSGRAA